MSTVLTSIAPIWKVLIVGLIAGAGLPAMFALGLRFLVGSTPVGESAVAEVPAGNKALAGVFFFIVLLGVLAGLFILAAPSAVLKHFGLS